jgi:glycosyltransferase involved in cell wall biosynthesis
MRVLVVSFYYRPDLSAGSFRATSLVAAMRERAPPGTHIDVVTTLPNRYHSYVRDAERMELTEGLEIRRIPLPTHRSDMRGQSRAFLSFARGALAHVADRDYDLVFATSSRLMTATLGAWIARRKKALLYLDIRDLFLDNMRELLPPALAWPVVKAFSPVESWTMRRADRINLVSRGFENYFRSRYGERSFAWFTNGIDDEFLAAAPQAVTARPRRSEATILYAGNIGQGQALHEILPGLSAALRGRARFVVIGDGGRRAALARAVAGSENVELRGPLPRAALLEAYGSADVLFLHLGPQRAFRQVLPSKLFEYAALGKPVLAGVAGYAASFIREEIANAAVFPPGNVAGAVKAFEGLELTDRPRPDFIRKYARSHIAQAMANDVFALRRREPAGAARLRRPSSRGTSHDPR